MQHKSVNEYFKDYLSDVYGLTPKPETNPEGLSLFPMPGNAADWLDAEDDTDFFDEKGTPLFTQGSRAFYLSQGRLAGNERAKATSYGKIFPRLEEIRAPDSTETLVITKDAHVKKTFQEE